MFVLISSDPIGRLGLEEASKGDGPSDCCASLAPVFFSSGLFGSMNTRAYSSLPMHGPPFSRLDFNRFKITARDRLTLLDPPRFSWGSRDCSPTKHSLVDTHDASAHLLLALLPTTGMVTIALYIAVYMWKYGNDASIVVQSTVCNGWIFLFLGTLALLAGQIPPEVSKPRTCRAAPSGWKEGERKGRPRL